MARSMEKRLGWVNVYLDLDGVLAFGSPWPTKDGADNEARGFWVWAEGYGATSVKRLACVEVRAEDVKEVRETADRRFSEAFANVLASVDAV
jgi:hypothetical protein